MKEMYEYKLDLIYYGVKVTKNCFDSLVKGIDNQINHNDYITTKGLMIALDSKIYVNANINDNSFYSIDFKDGVYVLGYEDKYICDIDIIQPPLFALNKDVLDNGIRITDLVNIHGDRIRVQPIMGCANRCSFCDLNQYKYYKYSIEDLDKAFNYALNNHGFRHVLISGGTPLCNQEDFDYLNDVYRYFGEKYGSRFPIDIMLVPRGLNVTDDSSDAYRDFLMKLKEWKITGLSINLELYNDEYRKKYIPQKDLIGKEKYYEFIKIAVEIFGQGNVRSCIVVGLEDIEDSINGVIELSKLGCMPVLSPYIPINRDTSLPKPEFMKEVLLKSMDIVNKYGVQLGPLCNSCKHNTIHYK